MANLDELYARGKALKNRANLNKIIAIALAIGLLVFLQNVAKDGEDTFFAVMRSPVVPLAVSLFFIFGGTIWRRFFTASGQRSNSNNLFWAQNLQNFASNLKSENAVPSKELISLERERLELIKLLKKARAVAAVAAVVAVFLGWKLGEIMLGAVGAAMLYGGIFSLMTSSKTSSFRENFKWRIIGVLAAKYSLKYEPSGSLGLENFLRIYSASVDKYHGEDLLIGQIEGVNVAFSDFYAAKKVKTKNGTHYETLFQGVLFEADFNKTTKHYVCICHKDSQNLATYGTRAVMDDARFSEYFRVYSNDQIAARYVLTPLLMEQFLRLHLALNAPINAVVTGSKIYISIETWRDGFEPDIDASFIGSGGLARYEYEIAALASIAKELNLNRKIW